MLSACYPLGKIRLNKNIISNTMFIENKTQQRRGNRIAWIVSLVLIGIIIIIILLK
jgi:hypothetical protein